MHPKCIENSVAFWKPFWTPKGTSLRPKNTSKNALKTHSKFEALLGSRGGRVELPVPGPTPHSKPLPPEVASNFCWNGRRGERAFRNLSLHGGTESAQGGASESNCVAVPCLAYALNLVECELFSLGFARIRNHSLKFARIC